MPGRLVKLYREQKKLTIAEVAKRMRISAEEYVLIELNLHPVTIEQIKKLAGILDVPIIDLLNDGFEIHRPIDIFEHAVSKKELLAGVDDLMQLLENGKPENHPNYAVIMRIFQNMDQLVSAIH
jgi:transcriptional regulator with XRE-family HTH domain